AINVGGGQFTMINCTLSGNSAGGRGGAVYLTGATTSTITNSNFDASSGTPNVAIQGGAIALTTGTLAISGGTFDQNGASDRGGVGYFFGAATATISGATVTGNTSGS